MVKPYSKKPYTVKVLESLGAMSEIFEFLTPYEKIRMQEIDKWWYKRGVERIMTHISLPSPRCVYFVDVYREREKVIVFDRKTEKVTKIVLAKDSDEQMEGRWNTCAFGRRSLFQLKDSDTSCRILQIDD